MWSGGTILGGTVAWSLLRMSYYFWTSDLGVELSTSVLFMAGSLLCLPTCWLSTLVPYHNKSMAMSATLMGLLSVAMLLLSLGMSSMSSLSRAVRDPATLNSSMLRAMSIDAFDPAVRSSFAAMQMELRCCGVESYFDWYRHRRSLPPACCGRAWNGKRGDICDVPLFSMGCLRPALVELRYFTNTLSALSSALVIVMAVTLFAAAYMLVTDEVERAKARAYKLSPSPLRIGIACLTPPVHAPPPPRASYIEPVMPPPVGNVI
ncbi:uncharacterized protein LOC142973983 isoform X2 [Anticarsia gemmatalis]|uniref:uncharacterized protein LOC142973983 isoform X2 n=1 Tax=Anticarsia gemmatalis TaxID=129554 RepID=UPI003F766310